MSPLDESILDAMHRAIGPAKELVLLHRPYLPPSAWQYVKECLDTGWVSSAGSFVSKFEEELARFTGCRRAVATVNGTAALEVCFHLAGVQAGDEVICPSLTFVATANAVSHCGAIPHFVDVSRERLSISPDALRARLREVATIGSDGSTRNRETGRRLAAICLMHCFGHPGDLDAIAEISGDFNIPLIEDSAESLGSFYKGKHTGRYGLLSAVSFNGNKILTTGGGGAILTDDEGLADRAKHLTTTGKLPHAWEFEHDVVAWNYRLPNINAALGVSQLEVIDDLLRWKRELAERYQGAFANIAGAEFLIEPSDSRSNYWLNCVVLQSGYESERDPLLKMLNAAGYQCRPLWKPMHLLQMYTGCPRDGLTETESLYRRVINIPSSADLASPPTDDIK